MIDATAVALLLTPGMKRTLMLRAGIDPFDDTLTPSQVRAMLAAYTDRSTHD